MLSSLGAYPAPLPDWAHLIARQCHGQDESRLSRCSSAPTHRYAYMWNVGGYTLPLLALPAEHKLALGRLDKVHDMMIGRIIAILAGERLASPCRDDLV